MNTTENNKLIAEFMGIVFTKDNKANHPRIKAPYPPIECFKYHSDWNWLMEVVEKIESLDKNEGEFDCLCEIYGDRCCFISYHGEILVSYYADTKIEVVYNACIEFIKWYNEQNK